MGVIVDTHAWVEYFRGSEAGKLVQRIVEEPKNHIYTAECSVAELWDWATRGEIDSREALRTVMAFSTLVSITFAN